MIKLMLKTVVLHIFFEAETFSKFKKLDFFCRFPFFVTMYKSVTFD